MCATASRSRDLPARHTCCRAPASAGIPIVSVNTARSPIEIYRIGDRNLDRHPRCAITSAATSSAASTATRSSSCASSAASQVWKGELAVESPRSTPTSPPPSRSTRRSATHARRLRHGGAAEGAKHADDDYGSLATQWFIVSDLGLTAYSRQRRHPCLRQFAGDDAMPRAAIELRLISRSNEVLATRRTDANGHAQFEAGARARGGRRWRPRC